MENTEIFLPPLSQKENEKEKNNGLVHFIELEKSENKKIKIPCSNENIAAKVIASFKVVSGKQMLESALQKI